MDLKEDKSKCEISEMRNSDKCETKTKLIKDQCIHCKRDNHLDHECWFIYPHLASMEWIKEKLKLALEYEKIINDTGVNDKENNLENKSVNDNDVLNVKDDKVKNKLNERKKTIYDKLKPVNIEMCVSNSTPATPNCSPSISDELNNLPSFTFEDVVFA